MRNKSMSQQIPIYIPYKPVFTKNLCKCAMRKCDTSATRVMFYTVTIEYIVRNLVLYLFQPGMLTSIQSFEKTELDWVERLALTLEPAPPVPGTTEISENDKIQDDFKRELYL